MHPTAHRLLTLIGLLQARRHWSGAELAERLGVDRRSVRRDIERLRALGYPVQASSGVGGGYRLGAGAQVLPLLLDEDEAILVAIALRAAASSIAGMEDAARTVLGKLDPLVPARRQRQAGQVHAITTTLSDPPATDARVLGQLALACRENALLAFDYCSHHGQASQREVQALHLVNHGRRWYLLAWDLGRNDWRTLRVDRIGTVQRMPGSGLPRRLPAPADAMVRQAVSRSPFPLRAELYLAGSLATLEHVIPAWCGVLEEDGDAHCWLRMGAETPAMLAAQILSVGQRALAIRTDPPGLHADLSAEVAGLGALLAAG